MIEASVTCPCCGKEFSAKGETRQEALESANEALQDHLDTDEC